jgi:hypothetical protein
MELAEGGGLDAGALAAFDKATGYDAGDALSRSSSRLSDATHIEGLSEFS